MSPVLKFFLRHTALLVPLRALFGLEAPCSPEDGSVREGSEREAFSASLTGCYLPLILRQ